MQNEKEIIKLMWYFHNVALKTKKEKFGHYFILNRKDDLTKTKHYEVFESFYEFCMEKNINPKLYIDILFSSDLWKGEKLFPKQLLLEKSQTVYYNNIERLINLKKDRLKALINILSVLEFDCEQINFIGHFIEDGKVNLEKYFKYKINGGAKDFKFIFKVKIQDFDKALEIYSKKIEQTKKYINNLEQINEILYNRKKKHLERFELLIEDIRDYIKKEG